MYLSIENWYTFRLTNTSEKVREEIAKVAAQGIEKIPKKQKRRELLQNKQHYKN